ncbi:hypothetical protein ACFP56_21000 [Paenibacillus septentrionalis]|uniref:DUF5673 domain-containing protein n=1 Tax=Paenibacillus septentrionalis TaxID=429342 RepID=A0ABW1VB77_9BACL
MEWIVLSSIGCCIVLFIYRECVALYIARIKTSGIILESRSVHFFHQHTDRRMQQLDRLLIAAAVVAFFLYSWMIVDRWRAGLGIEELTVLEIGIMLLVYIVYPTRNITHFITEKGLVEQENIMDWSQFYAIYVTDEAVVRRMLLVTFKGRSSQIEGYMYDRDLGSLKQLAAPHSIMLSEL